MPKLRIHYVAARSGNVGSPSTRIPVRSSAGVIMPPEVRRWPACTGSRSWPEQSGTRRRADSDHRPCGFGLSVLLTAAVSGTTQAPRGPDQLSPAAAWSPADRGYSGYGVTGNSRGGGHSIRQQVEVAGYLDPNADGDGIRGDTGGRFCRIPTFTSIIDPTEVRSCVRGAVAEFVHGRVANQHHSE